MIYLETYRRDMSTRFYPIDPTKHSLEIYTSSNKRVSFKCTDFNNIAKKVYVGPFDSVSIRADLPPFTKVEKLFAD